MIYLVWSLVGDRRRRGVDWCQGFELNEGNQRCGSTAAAPLSTCPTTATAAMGTLLAYYYCYYCYCCPSLLTYN